MGFGTLVQRIPFKISGRSASSSGLYVPQDVQYDYALGGIPFLSGTGDQRPDIEKPVQQRKDQFDAFKDPGEYSLNQWWLRSQTSFIGGAGVIYQDPDTQGAAKNIRYYRSVGVDPFTDPDLLGLLKETELATSNTSVNNGLPYCESQINTFGDCVWIARGDKVEMRTVSANNLPIQSSATLASSGVAAFVEGLAVFSNVGVTPVQHFSMSFMRDTTAVANAGIWRVNENSAVSTRIYLPPAIQDFITVAKARGLLAVGAQNNFYALDPYAAAGTAWPAAPNAAVPKDQTIVSITDGPDAVYIGANSATQGYIWKTTVDNLGVINGVTLTAVLPLGEKINDAQSYVNTFMVIASNSGIRVGTFSTGSAGVGLSYSPQLITVPVTATNSGFGQIAFYGTKAYVCTLGQSQHDGDRGLMAVDLSTLIQDQNTGATFNAYSTWNYFPTSTAPVTDVTVTQTGRPVFVTDTGTPSKVYVEHATTLISMGYLDTGRCRFNTVEPKLFKYISLRTPTPLQGEVTITLLDDTGGSTSYITYGPTLSPGTSDIATPTPGGPRNWEAFRFTLRRGASDVTVGAKLDSWQIKALPGTLKQRIIMRNFLCFNDEKDKTGQRIRGDFQSLSKLTAVRQMCQRGDTVTFQDLVNNVSTQVIVDDYQFTMLTTPGPNAENYGGYLTVTMRTVADSVPDFTPVLVEGD